MYECYEVIDSTDKKEIYTSSDLSLRRNERVVISSGQGTDWGRVISLPIYENDQPGGKKVLRKLTSEDEIRIDENNKMSEDAFQTCKKKIVENELAMKLIKTRYTLDRRKTLFFFVSEERVDFRSLVKELAHSLRTRIELRQVGARDAAGLHGGFGTCGRSLCCSTWLKDFNPITIRMAKIQGLALASDKITGVCGRLKCCLAYENDMYKILKKEFPKIGSMIEMGGVKGKVVRVDVIKSIILVKLKDGNVEEIKVRYREDTEEGSALAADKEVILGGNLGCAVEAGGTCPVS